MNSWSDVLAVALVAAVVTSVLTRIAIPLLRELTWVDQATERSSHQGEVPRGGGVPVVLVMCVTVLLLCRDTTLVVIVVAVALMASVGATDDARGLRPKTRLLAQSLTASVLVIGMTTATSVKPPHLIFVVLAFVSFVAFVNAFNFMDGINGISAVSAFVAGAWYGILGQTFQAAPLIVVGVVTAACAAGFATWNLTGRIFLGDAGSYGLGAAVVASSLYAWSRGVPWLLCVAALSIYLLDTGLTICRRAYERASLAQAHRTHVYQLLVHQRGWSHAGTSAWVGAHSVVLCAIAYGAFSTGLPDVVTLLLFLAVGISYLAPVTMHGSHGSRTQREPA